MEPWPRPRTSCHLPKGDATVRDIATGGSLSDRRFLFDRLDTIMADSFSPQDIANIGQRIKERGRSALLTVPVTAIYSRNDAVVAWEACIDPDDGSVEHVEVTSSHIGMNLDPDVWTTIRERLGAEDWDRPPA